jgi:TatD DNase family protein
VFVDSHCHLNYLEEPTAALARARDSGVRETLCIGVDQGGIEQVLGLAAALQGVWASVGEHPGSCSGDAAWVEGLLQRPDVVAVGEMGLDYHYETDEAQRAKQRHTFEQQLAIADRAALPVVIHTRAAEADTLSLLRAFPNVTGVLHCFTESWQMAQAAIDMGYYVSISGIVTFRNADNVRDVARQIPAERLLIETDAPWLAPVPYRGKKNEPAYVAATAAFLAELRQQTLETLAATTRDNFFRLFSRAQRLFV